MLKPTALANAAATMTAVLSIICLALAYIAPGFLFALSRSWFHAINLEAIRLENPVGFGTALVGIISLAAVAWVTFYAGALLYNRWAQ